VVTTETLEHHQCDTMSIYQRGADGIDRIAASKLCSFCEVRVELLFVFDCKYTNIFKNVHQFMNCIHQNYFISTMIISLCKLNVENTEQERSLCKSYRSCNVKIILKSSGFIFYNNNKPNKFINRLFKCMTGDLFNSILFE